MSMIPGEGAARRGGPPAAVVLLIVVALSWGGSRAWAGQVSAPRAPGAAMDDPRWLPWLGCWAPLERAGRDQQVRVCVERTEDRRGVEMITLAGDERVLSESVIADLSQARHSDGACEGEKQSRWSRDGDRVLTTAELRCPGKGPQRTSGISTLLNISEWLDIQVVRVDGAESVRVRRYVRAAGPFPSAVADRVVAASAPQPGWG